MPYYQSNTLKYALCSLSSPERRGGGEVLERVCSKLGGGLERAIVPVDSSVIPIEGPYTTRSSDLSTMVLRNIDCASLNAEYSLIDRHFSIINDLKTVNNQETDLYFYHSDHLGSSSFITDADGIVSQHLQYLPYGELFAEQRDNTARYYTPYKFSGKEKDEETGYSYFGARYYMPELSIWSAVDPMADERTWLSPYNYCQNNPVMLVDPDGMLDDEWNLNTVTGEMTKVGTLGGSDYQFVNIVTPSQDGGLISNGTKVIDGSSVFSGPVRGGFGISNVNLWEGIPHGYNSNSIDYLKGGKYEYSMLDLKKRYQILNQGLSGSQAIKDFESSGNAQPIHSIEFSRQYTAKWNTNKSFWFAIEAGYWAPADASSIASDFLEYQQVGRASPKSFKYSPRFSSSHSNVTSKTSSSWNDFLSSNKGKYKGKDWIKAASNDHYKWKLTR